VAIPEEVRAAKRINAEGERILEKAHDESTRIVSRAQEQAAFLIGERGLTETAQAEGRRIVEQAEDVADGIRRGADDYAANILGTLEEEAVTALAGIRKGIDVLEERRAELQAPEPELAPEPMLSETDVRVTEDEEAGSRSPSLR
jgi:cell division septum initiation protein DivIVA